MLNHTPTDNLAGALLGSLTVEHFQTAACLETLLQHLHGGAVACPACGSADHTDRQQAAYRSGRRICCKGCSRWFDYRSGTILCGTTLSPERIMQLAIYHGLALSPAETAERIQLHSSTVRDWYQRLTITGMPIEKG